MLILEIKRIFIITLEASLKINYSKVFAKFSVFDEVKFYKFLGECPW